MSEQLLPCPFCGVPGTLREMDDDIGWRYEVACWNNDCDAEARSGLKKTEFEAVERWNRRTLSPWIDFRTQRPADGQQVEWCWNYQGWQPGDYWQYAVSPGGPNGASWLIFWRPWRFEPPSAEMIEKAKEGKDQ